MKRILFQSGILLVLLWVATGIQPVRANNAVVGTGTPASCTETAFDTALATVNSGGGMITFNCGPTPHTIVLSNQKILLTSQVTIHGADRMTLSGGHTTRLFFVGGGTTLRLQNIILIQGDSSVGGGAIEASAAQIFVEAVQLIGNQALSQGGAIYCYGGSGGTLTVRDSLFQGNIAPAGGAIYNDGCAVTIQRSTFQANGMNPGNGGGIYNAAPGRLTIDNTLFQQNTALDGPGLYNATGAQADLTAVTLRANTGGYGGGIENSGTLTLTQSLLDQNTVTGSGGGLWNLGGVVTLRQTTVSNNRAYEGGGINSYGQHMHLRDVNMIGNMATGSHGGGIYVSSGTAFVHNATLSRNQARSASADGGGIYQRSDDNLTLTNVTLADNQAGRFGGGLYHYGRYAILTNVTLANNLAGAAGNAIYEDSPQSPSEPGLIQMANSVIFGSPNNCDGALFQSLGYNLSRGSCTSLNTASDRDNYSGSLNLGSLAFNGGSFPMHTILPWVGSPLINTGDPLQCSVLDQRGGSRVGTCDIGSVEAGAAARQLYLSRVLR